MTAHDWLEITRGEAPLVVSIPHTGTELADLEPRLVSSWLGRKDTDWHIEKLYGFAAGMGATVVRTAISRTVIDVNRDPSGASLYPGQATTALCPTTTFDGEPLYREAQAPGADEIAARKATYFDPYHAALRAEIDRLREQHPAVVVYDCHSIRSAIPRLFEGELAHFNIGTNSGASCDADLTAHVLKLCAVTEFRTVANARFKGGHITRRFGRPERGVHAIQMELACRSYMAEPADPPGAANWPSPWDKHYAAPMGAVLEKILQACLDFADGARRER